MSNGFTINNHQRRLKNIKKGRLTRDDVGQGVIERCLGVGKFEGFCVIRVRR